MYGVTWRGYFIHIKQFPPKRLSSIVRLLRSQSLSPNFLSACRNCLPTWHYNFRTICSISFLCFIEAMTSDTCSALAFCDRRGACISARKNASKNALRCHAWPARRAISVACNKQSDGERICEAFIIIFFTLIAFCEIPHDVGPTMFPTIGDFCFSLLWFFKFQRIWRFVLQLHHGCITIAVTYSNMRFIFLVCLGCYKNNTEKCKCVHLL